MEKIKLLNTQNLRLEIVFDKELQAQKIIDESVKQYTVNEIKEFFKKLTENSNKYLSISLLKNVNYTESATNALFNKEKELRKKIGVIETYDFIDFSEFKSENLETKHKLAMFAFVYNTILKIVKIV